ncbi:hypothetical protein [Demequina oxidasica]|uniref:hypothetical protein n=1 Tax=Demequina oxidasica TaxID=676199 RepID=UPI0007814617|nr:hypothetical protein [Demequina oxidasica]
MTVKQSNRRVNAKSRIAAILAMGLSLAVAAGGAASAVPVLDHDAQLDGSTATVQVAAGSDGAGRAVSILVFGVDADRTSPRETSIVFVDEATLNAAGALEFVMELPQADLEGYVLSLAVSGAEPYLKLLNPDGVLPPVGETDGNAGTPGDGNGEPGSSDGSDPDPDVGTGSAGSNGGVSEAGQTGPATTQGGGPVSGELSSTGGTVAFWLVVVAALALTIGLILRMVARHRTQVN